jgi:hypothetical protein
MSKKEVEKLAIPCFLSVPLTGPPAAGGRLVKLLSPGTVLGVPP